MRDFLMAKGTTDIFGSRDASRGAFNTGLITNGGAWMDMIKSRNMSSHTYNEETAEEIKEKIPADYHPLLNAFAERMLGIKDDENK